MLKAKDNTRSLNGQLSCHRQIKRKKDGRWRWKANKGGGETSEEESKETERVRRLCSSQNKNS